MSNFWRTFDSCFWFFCWIHCVYELLPIVSLVFGFWIYIFFWPFEFFSWHIMRTVHLISFTLGMCFVNQGSPVLNLVRFGRVIRSIMINFEPAGDRWSVTAAAGTHQHKQCCQSWRSRQWLQSSSRSLLAAGQSLHVTFTVSDRKLPPASPQAKQTGMFRTGTAPV